MNAAAMEMLKAAADRKKANWKDPVVKSLKVTKEQYLQEKAEEEAKKNKKKNFLSSASEPATDDAALQRILQQVQQERNLFVKEKMAMMQSMQDTKAEMVQLKSQMMNSSAEDKPVATPPPSSLPSDVNDMERDLDATKDRVAALEAENTKLRSQISKALEKLAEMEQEVSRAAPPTGEQATEELSRLEQLVQDVERRQTEMQHKLAVTQNNDQSIIREQIESMEKKVAMLDLAVKKKSRSKTPAKERKVAEEPVDSEESELEKCLRSKTPTKRRENADELPVHSPATSKKSAVSSKLSSPKTPKKNSVAAKPSAPKTPKTPKKSSVKSSSPKGSPTPPVGSNEAIVPHAASSLAKAQARDEKLMDFMEKSGGGAMYPKFSMSVKMIEGYKIVHFYKKVYIPASLADRTLEYYRDTHGENWTRVLAKQVIWPSLDADVTVFKHKR